MEKKALTRYFRELLTRWQKWEHRPYDILQGKDGVVVVGAGKVGLDFLTALQGSKIPVFAFSDNNQLKWGSILCGLPILAPDEAVKRFGSNAVFLITIGRVGKGIKIIRDQFVNLGARSILHFIDSIRFLPKVWPHFFVNPNVFSDLDCEYVVKAYSLFEDDKSRRNFLGHLAWRITLDPNALPLPEYDNQYFPADIISPLHCSNFVDIGAFTGDTLLALKAFAGSSLSAYYGFEPDPLNYKKLQAQAIELSQHANVVGFTENVAIGDNEKMISFASNGTATSHAGGTGDVQTLCKRLDSLAILRPTFVKIDTEGFEHEVLMGGRETLMKWGPNVAIASYHRPKDMFELPLWLEAIFPDYTFYLRSHGDAGVDLFCYAINEQI